MSNVIYNAIIFFFYFDQSKQRFHSELNVLFLYESNLKPQEFSYTLFKCMSYFIWKTIILKSICIGVVLPSWGATCVLHSFNIIMNCHIQINFCECNLDPNLMRILYTYLSGRRSWSRMHIKIYFMLLCVGYTCKRRNESIALYWQSNSWKCVSLACLCTCVFIPISLCMQALKWICVHFQYAEWRESKLKIAYIYIHFTLCIC